MRHDEVFKYSIRFSGVPTCCCRLQTASGLSDMTRLFSGGSYTGLVSHALSKMLHSTFNLWQVQSNPMFTTIHFKSTPPPSVRLLQNVFEARIGICAPATAQLLRQFGPFVELT